MSLGTHWFNIFLKGTKHVKINIHNQTTENVKTISKTLKKLFRKIKDNQSMELIFISQKAIHDMNLNFRDIDRATDVLSFINDDEDSQSLGDIFISLEQAERQAEDYNHSFAREVGFLAVHGYLHLKGYDHQNETEEKIMIKVQEEILNQAKLNRR